jgi:hypothetical protein
MEVYFATTKLFGFKSLMRLGLIGRETTSPTDKEVLDSLFPPIAGDFEELIVSSGSLVVFVMVLYNYNKLLIMFDIVEHPIVKLVASEFMEVF